MGNEHIEMGNNHTENTDIETVEVEKFQLTIYKNDNVISKHARNGELWEKKFFNFYKVFYDKGKDILDIGAFIGTSTLMFSRIVNNGGKVKSFEPLHYDVLEKNVKDNNLEDKVEIHRIALSDSHGFIPKKNFNNSIEANFGGRFIHELHWGEPPYVDPSSIYDKNQYIELRTIDSYNFDNVGLVKIDACGFEKRILDGARQTLIDNDYPPVFIEIWEIESWREDYKVYFENFRVSIYDFFKDLGYIMYDNKHQDYIFIHL